MITVTLGFYLLKSIQQFATSDIILYDNCYPRVLPTKCQYKSFQQVRLFSMTTVTLGFYLLRSIQQFATSKIILYDNCYPRVLPTQSQYKSFQQVRLFSMITVTQKRTIFGNTTLNLQYNDIDICMTSCDKILGIHVDHNLNWHNHYNP